MTYKNTFNKMLWLTRQASLKKKTLQHTADRLHFDEIETIHHTKCKPISIAIAVNDRYQILDLQVAEMPAKGRLAEFSRQKYGPRKDERDERASPRESAREAISSISLAGLTEAKSPEELILIKLSGICRCFGDGGEDSLGDQFPDLKVADSNW